MSGLGAYALNRLAMAGLVILVALSVNFVIPRLMPGDPVEQQLAAISAAGGQVGCAKIGYDGDVCQLGQPGGIEQLYRITLLRTMANGLPMGAQRSDRSRWKVGLGQQEAHDLRIELGESEAGSSRPLELVGSARLQTLERFAQRSRDGRTGEGERAKTGAIFRKHAVDRVNAGARHQPDDEQAAVLDWPEAGIHRDLEKKTTTRTGHARSTPAARADRATRRRRGRSASVRRR